MRRAVAKRRKKHRTQLFALALGASLQAVLIAILWAERRRRVRGQQELHWLSGQLLKAQEDERGRIARDLHDHVCQQLALLAIELDMPAAQPTDPTDMDPAPAGTTSLAWKARAIAADVHALARELHPARLEHLGLVSAVRSLGLDVERVHHLRVDVLATNWPAELPRALVYCFYRVAQEALQNVLKHSRAGVVQLAFRATPRRLQLIIADDGRGFDAESAAARQGIGVASMRERLRVVGGTLVIQSTPTQGTRVVASVPRSGF
jgi:signal transduction histidine kinase